MGAHSWEDVAARLVADFNAGCRKKSYLQRVPPVAGHHLFATNAKGEGFFLVRFREGETSTLDRKVFKAIATEAADHGLSGRYHVFAQFATYSGGGGLEFYKLSDAGEVLEIIRI